MQAQILPQLGLFLCFTVIAAVVGVAVWALLHPRLTGDACKICNGLGILSRSVVGSNGYRSTLHIACHGCGGIKKERKSLL